MSLPRQQRVAIDRLLLQREEQFLRVHSCESEIEAILGAAYPFPPPPDLPSRQKRRTPKKAAGRTAAKPAKRPRIALAPLALEDGESAYRIVYLAPLSPPDDIETPSSDNPSLPPSSASEAGTERSETHLDRASVEAWLNLDTPQPLPLRVETIDSAGDLCRLLWQAE